MVEEPEGLAGRRRFAPLTAERWSDLVELFGPRGGCGGCWCMWWRLARRVWEEQKGDGNREALRELVGSGREPGVLGYLDRRPVAWCAVEPRERYASLERSRVLARVDDEPVWSVTCFFVARSVRGSGWAEAILRAAVEHATARGAHLIEAYPTAPGGRRLAPVSTFLGVPSTFARVGFEEVARPSSARVVMRYRVDERC